MTDYVAFVHRIAPDAVIGEMDSIYSHWATRAPGGFTDAQLATLRDLGVGAAQGWLLGLPMPADEFVRSCSDLAEAAEV